MADRHDRDRVSGSPWLERVGATCAGPVAAVNGMGCETGVLMQGITVDQMVEVDRLMTEEYGIALLQMMENAGRGLAAVARRMLGGSAAARSVVVLVGKGNNGGGGLVAARHLATAGADVRVALAANPGELGDTPEHQRRTLERIGIWGGDCRADPDDLSPLLQGTDLVLDALIGYGLRGAPREPVADFIHAANAAPVSRLALDLPSGLDGDSGAPREPCIRATATLTLAWPKVGLLVEAARDYVGDLYLADIGVPTPVYRAVGVASGQVFARGPLVRVGRDEGTWRVITTPQMGDSFR